MTASGLNGLAGDDARLGRVFTGVGVFGLIAALAIGVVGTAVILAVTHSMDRSLTVTAGAVEAADDTVVLAAETVDIVSEAFDTLVPSAGLAAGSFEDAAGVISDTSAVVTEEVPAALDAVLDAMPAIERVAGIVDSTLRALSLIGVDYDPAVPFDDAVAEVAAAIAPLPEQLRAQAVSLSQLAADFEEFGAASASIADDLANLQGQLDEASRLLTEYAAAAADASLVVDDIQSNLQWQRWLMVVAVVIGALAFASLQVVPLTLGRRLQRGAGGGTGMPVER
jgi:methyl-accepting chemotaxis protein